MPGLIPDMNFQPYVQPNQDLPIKDIQEYQQEQRDKYAQALSLKNTAQDALLSNKNVLDIDRPQYTADANAIQENLGTLGGNVGNYEDNVGKAQHLARETKARIDYYGERHKDYNENLKKITEDKNYSPISNSEHGNVLTYVNSGGQGKIKNVDFVKPVDIIDLAAKTQGAIKERKWENDPILSNVAGIPVLESITSGTYSKKRIEDLVKLRNENDPELNQYNQQEAFSKAVNGKTGEWLGISQKDIDDKTIQYLDANNLPHTRQNIVNFQYQEGLSLKKQHDLEVMTKAVETGLVDSRSVQDKNLPEGYGAGNGSKSEKVTAIPPGADINTDENANKNTNVNDVHLGGFAIKTSRLQRSSGLDYYDNDKKLKHVTSANIDFDYVKNRPFAKSNVVSVNKDGNEIDVPRGTPLNLGDITNMVNKFKEKNKGATVKQVQEYINKNVGSKLMADAFIYNPSNPADVSSGYIPLKEEDIDDIVAQNNIKSKKEYQIIKDEVDKQGRPYDISNIYKGEQTAIRQSGQPNTPFDYSKIIQ